MLEPKGELRSRVKIDNSNAGDTHISDVSSETSCNIIRSETLITLCSLYSPHSSYLMRTYQRKEFARLSRAAHFQNMELLHASFITHTFPRHWHETFVIEVVEQGIDEFLCEGATYRATAGSIVIINPGEVHTGSPLGNVPLSYRSMYPTPALMSWSISQVDERRRDVPFFPSRVVHNPSLAVMLRKAHRSLERGDDACSSSSLLLHAFTQLILRHSKNGPALNANGLESSSVKRVKQYISENFTHQITLNQLSIVAELSSFHLLRAFHKSVGLPPYEFLLNVRIERAKGLLKRGEPIAQVSCSTGFYDQSHLNRHFKRIVGVTPGEYVA
jgi:AraC-like DNA-binding protein